MTRSVTTGGSIESNVARSTSIWDDPNDRVEKIPSRPLTIVVEVHTTWRPTAQEQREAAGVLPPAAPPSCSYAVGRQGITMAACPPRVAHAPCHIFSARPPPCKYYLRKKDARHPATAPSCVFDHVPTPELWRARASAGPRNETRKSGHASGTQKWYTPGGVASRTF